MAQLRKYETIVVSRPGLEIEEREALHKKVTNVLEKHSGDLIVFEIWGKRRLAYTIKKTQKAYYTYYVYVAEGTVVSELTSMLRLREDVLKYLTVKVADSVDTARLDEERNLEKFQVDESHDEAHGDVGKVNAPKVAEKSVKDPDKDDGDSRRKDA